MRYPPRRGDKRATRFIDPGRLIGERPDIVEKRERAGDWEGDLIVGAASRSAIGTLVDRRTRHVKLVYLPDGHAAPLTAKAITVTMASVPEQARNTLTWDQGTEMAAHATIAPLFIDGVYFAHADKPWLRATPAAFAPRASSMRRWIRSAATPTRSATNCRRPSRCWTPSTSSGWA